MKKKTNGNMAVITNLVEEVTRDTAKVIGVPAELIRFVGNTQEAVFLSQLIYWSDKGNRSDGYIFKTKKEWKDETGLSESQITRYTKKFKVRGFLDTKLKKANGNPTVHYKVDIEKLFNLFRLFLTNRYEKNQRNESLETSESLTENTSQNIHDTTTKERGTLTYSSKVDLKDLSNECGKVSKQLSTSDFEKSSNESSPIKETKILVPADFRPTLDAKFRAAIAFPNKSQSFATEKFIKHFTRRELKKTAADWHDEWWNWMHTERPSYGNDSIDTELEDIRDEVVDRIWRLQETLPYVFHITHIVNKAQTEGFSEETVDEVLEQLVSNDYFAQIESFYFNLEEYTENKEWNRRVKEKLVECGLTY